MSSSSESHGTYENMTSDTALPVELLACPFCGGTDINTDGPCYTQFMCNGCGVGQYDQPGHAKAITAWNTRALSATRTDPWEPIETAPKDGTSILIWKPDEPRVGEYMMSAYWCDDQEGFVPVGGLHKQGYFSEWAGRDQGHPTHWQPLPAPPISTEGE